MFPPLNPTTLTKVIPSYLYQQYNDDDNLQGFVRAYNTLAQNYVDWFVNVGIPVYTGNQVEGLLLDWVAQGLYGMARPSITNQKVNIYSTLNSAPFNKLAFNKYLTQTTGGVFTTTDDVFKRILTWHLYKGDGKVINVQWLKRRVMRFLSGVNGTDPVLQQTNQVSVSFIPPNICQVTILKALRTLNSGAVFNKKGFAFNKQAFNGFATTSQAFPAQPVAATFQAAAIAGALDFPFQMVLSVIVE